METQILSRDYQAPPPAKDRLAQKGRIILGRFLAAIKKLKSTKYITISVLIGSFLLILGAFAALSNSNRQKEAVEQEIAVKVENPSPSPVSSEISQKVEGFFNKLEDAPNLSKKIQKPIVDLDINLGKR